MITTSDVEQTMESFGSSAREYSPKAVVAAAVACVKKFGYVSSQVWERESTRTTVSRILYPATQGKAAEDDRALIADMAETLHASGEKAEKIIETLISEFKDSDNGYRANLYAILSGDVVDSKHMGLAVSAVIAYDKMIEGEKLRKQWEAEKEGRDAKSANLSHIGTIGEKITISGVVTKNMVIETMYGFSHLVIIEGESFIVKTFTTAKWSDDEKAEVGNNITLVGTVKAHDEYNGTPQTMMTRCKMI
jgi:hypothetical protein